MDLSALPVVPTDPADVPGYLQISMAIITDALVALDDIERKHDVEPDKPIEGLTRWADGTNWNPGSGEGLYRYTGGNWILIMGVGGAGAYLKLAGGTMTGEIDMGTDKIVGVVDPTSDQEVATKKYVDDNVGFTNALLHVQDEKAQNTAGGTFTSGAWRTRDLNTVKTNEITSASLASNQITLPAGDYWVEANAAATIVNRAQLRVENVDDSVTLALGVIHEVGVDTVSSDGAISQVSGRFTLVAAKDIELQHRCILTRSTNGFGAAGNWGIEIYSSIRIWKTA